MAEETTGGASAAEVVEIVNGMETAEERGKAEAEAARARNEEEIRQWQDSRIAALEERMAAAEAALAASAVNEKSSEIESDMPVESTPPEVEMIPGQLATTAVVTKTRSWLM